ncbi:MAG: iron ABC transporter permease [Clostridia bacterium]|nr:iron ABC transporter permease [Clostridia bacterium]
MNILQKFFIPKYSLKTKRKAATVIFPILSVLTFAAALLFGASEISFSDALRSLISGDTGNTDFRILFYIRLPRALGAFLAGASLAVSGIIIQAVLNNPMAAPNLIGVNAGAGFFVILTMAIFRGLLPYLPFAAFLGALLTALLIYAISALTDAGKITVTLVGIAVGSILTAGINTVKTLFPDSVYDVSGFLIGGLSSVNFASVLPAGAMIVPALLIAFLFSGKLDALSLGAEVAGGLGIRVRNARLLWLTLAAVLAGAAVSFAGLIGFVGLIVPHVMRKFVGSTHRYLIPLSVFGGGTFLLTADILSRILFIPYELPVGILLSLVGGPFFIFLILTERRCS